MNAYPIKFNPILKQKVWGGNKLKNILNKDSEKNNIGESWEISGVSQNISVVNNGCYKGDSLTGLLSTYTTDFLGEDNFKVYGNEFPLLIKFLDAERNLSVQVHPDDEMARAHNSFGKTEMWYIMDSDDDAEIILGLNKNQEDLSVLEHVTGQNVYDVFNAIKVQEGAHYFIPAGKVHAIGAGVLAAEIQQTSDITYRVYDWDRADVSGNTRDLHIEEAILATKRFDEVLEMKDQSCANTNTNTLVHCEFFTTNLLKVKKESTINYGSLDSFVIFMCVEGEGVVTVNNHTEPITKGETILIPACASQVVVRGDNLQLLEVYIKN
jgi:mannose-6-phosphate isomerase